MSRMTRIRFLATDETRIRHGLPRRARFRVQSVILTIYFFASCEGFSTTSAQLRRRKKDVPTDGVANPRINGSQAEPPSRLIRGIATPSVGIIRCYPWLRA